MSTDIFWCSWCDKYETPEAWAGDAKPLRSCFHHHSKNDMPCFVMESQTTQTQATRTPLLRLTLPHPNQGNCLMGKSKRQNERLNGSVKATEHLVTMHCSSIQSSFLCKWVTNTVHMESWTSHLLLTITFLCTHIWESELTSNYFHCCILCSRVVQQIQQHILTVCETKCIL